MDGNGPVTLSQPAFTGNRWARGTAAPPTREAYSWHTARPGYVATPLVSLRNVAAALGLEDLWVKDETRRFGLPSFKVLGASWAAEVTLTARSGVGPDPVLVAATDGNWGRAVARIARDRAWGALVILPADVPTGRVEAIRGEGAEVEVIAGTYDDAVRRAEDLAATVPSAVLLSDTATDPGDARRGPSSTATPRSSGRWRRRSPPGERRGPTSSWRRSAWAATPRPSPGTSATPAGTTRPRCTASSPPGPPAAFASAAAGRVVDVPITSGSRMVGLMAGRVSACAWPDVAVAFEGFASIDDDWGIAARGALHGAGVAAGDTGSSGLAGLLALRHLAGGGRGGPLEGIRRARRALIVVTDGGDV